MWRKQFFYWKHILEQSTEYNINYYYVMKIKTDTIIINTIDILYSFLIKLIPTRIYIIIWSTFSATIIHIIIFTVTR